MLWNSLVNEFYFGHVPSLIFFERSTSAIIITKNIGEYIPINDDTPIIDESISSGWINLKKYKIHWMVQMKIAVIPKREILDLNIKL